MPLPISATSDLTKVVDTSKELFSGFSTAVQGQGIQNSVSFVKTFKDLFPSGFMGADEWMKNAGKDNTEKFDQGNIGGAANAHAAGRVLENEGLNKMMGILGTPGGWDTAAGSMGTEWFRNMTGKLSDSMKQLYKEADMLPDINPWGRPVANEEEEWTEAYGSPNYTQNYVTYEYTAPTGTYSQGEGADKPQYENTQKYGWNEGQLESGKGKVSIIPGVDNNEELLSSTKAGRR